MAAAALVSRGYRSLRRCGVWRGLCSGAKEGEPLVKLERMQTKESGIIGWKSLPLQNQEGSVALLTLNRPKALNALNSSLIEELSQHLKALQAEDGLRVAVLTGQGKAFAAGADIKEMKGRTFATALEKRMLVAWENAIAQFRKPIIAAVNGLALGGGCELAMMCDIIIAAKDKAKFGQPELALGTIPGAGGSQRITRAAGKSMAMEMILANRWITADEALSCAIVSRVVPDEDLLSEALNIAAEIAKYPSCAVELAKDCINKAFETPLQTGLQYERRSFQALFGTEDCLEGMSAFAEKRDPKWRHK